jgi:hypothetical protein
MTYVATSSGLQLIEFTKGVEKRKKLAKFFYVFLQVIITLATVQNLTKKTLHNHGHIDTLTLCHVMPPYTLVIYDKSLNVTKLFQGSSK